MRLEKLVERLDASWLGSQKDLDMQMNVVMDILRLGAYSVPGPVLNNEQVDLHVQDVLKKDFIQCCKFIKQGIRFIQ